MKTKKFEKKLVLNKKTIAHLANGELNAAKGGDPGLETLQLITCRRTCIITGYPCIVCASPID